MMVAALGTMGAGAPALAAAPVPKVVLVVGPVGSLTASYRAQADDAAAAAAAAGAEVVRVYSPNATWPAVQRATAGASIVVYLGHGNGWPSRYRDSLFPVTQNGFGLNPVAGVDDSAHQYFGEASVQSLRLAPNAVVVLSHLCYASGNTEPGLPEGTTDQAIQRVDNYASGFLRAGARAVIAEGHLGPAYYVRALLASRLSVEQIWQRSPTANGHVSGFASVRSPGYTAWLDPDNQASGYFRSLVAAGVRAADMRASAAGSPGPAFIGPPAQPSLASFALRFGTPSLRSLPIAGNRTTLTLPLPKASVASFPKGAQVGVRWDPIILDPPTSATPPSTALLGSPASPSPSSTPTPSGSPVPSVSPDPAVSPNPTLSPDPAQSPDPDAVAPPVALVAPEQLGSVVTLAAAKPGSAGLSLDVAYPSAPGLYRLVPTLHTSTGVAYDAATQALLTPVTVRVAGPVAAAYGVVPSLSIGAGSSSSIAVRVANVGSQPWDEVSSTMPAHDAKALMIWLRTSRLPARLVATWISVAGLSVPDPVSTALDPAVSAAGGSGALGLDLVAPTEPGEYLLLLDVLTSSGGSLSAMGSAPGLVRVTVSPGASPAAAASPAPAASLAPAASPAPAATPGVDSGLH